MGPTFETQDIDFSIPQSAQDYNEYEVDGIKVYVDKKARVATPTLKFDVNKKLFFYEIVVSELSLKKQG